MMERAQLCVAFLLVTMASSHFVDREMVGHHHFPVLPVISALRRRGYAGVITLPPPLSSVLSSKPIRSSFPV
jgi:sugar phosphate isomerase/epimerase